MHPAAQGAFIAIAYLIGAIPFGLLLARSRGIELRHVGSGNIGATNLGRALGKPWAVGAFFLDFAKGCMPVLAALHWPGAARPEPWLPAACAAAAVAGHVFPVYLGFRGGKGVATTLGVLTALAWVVALGAGLVWATVFRLSRTVSLASIAAALTLPLASWATGLLTASGPPPGTTLLSGALAALVVWRHRSNIARLLSGQELHFRKATGPRTTGPRTTGPRTTGPRTTGPRTTEPDSP